MAALLEGDLPPRVTVRPDAADFIRGEGGSVYIWAESSGFTHIRTEPPDHAAVAWTQVESEGVEVNIDASVDEVRVWTILLHHLPWKRLDFATDLTFSVGQSGALP